VALPCIDLVVVSGQNITARYLIRDSKISALHWNLDERNPTILDPKGQVGATKYGAWVTCSRFSKKMYFPPRSII